ncbi:hypothetical protein KSP39_PZI020850 [Platanthera zijinensis]|uniref:Uncharacterized protein n=1 Tax=Platanthera zijinensis TaxID=2320716 RepID=A0AAP0B125_9ASPA
MEEKEGVAAEANKTLAEIYNGIPDDSVDLTFNYLAILNDRKPKNAADQGLMEAIAVSDHSPEIRESSAITRDGGEHNNREFEDEEINLTTCSGSKGREEINHQPRCGIPHSNICALCSSYLRILRHRCLVCGRVYCRNCVGIGMGEMTEGRKCKDCLGRRFSQRYIKSAGRFGCCIWYPSEVKKQELTWAEKGPSRKYSGGLESGPQKPKARNGPAFIVTMSPGFSLGSQGVGLSGK